MSVLIKGMEMPKDTCEIRITVDQEGCWWARRIDVEDEWHEVSELTPHGRLIDADELLKHKGDAYDSRGHLLYAVGTGSIVTAPTIIEAEG